MSTFWSKICSFWSSLVFETTFSSVFGWFESKSWALFFFDSVATFFLETSSAWSCSFDRLNYLWLDSTLWCPSLAVSDRLADFIILPHFSLFSAYFICSMKAWSFFFSRIYRLVDLVCDFGSGFSSRVVSRLGFWGSEIGGSMKPTGFFLLFDWSGLTG